MEPIPRTTNFWAKTTEDGRPGISVRDHCLNVGCVAEALIAALPTAVRDLLPTVKLNRRNPHGRELPIQRLEDYHTVTGIRRASGKVDENATVQTYRHYLLDARFGALIEGPNALLEEIAAALRNPKWGVWLGRKCCLPASPVLAAPPGDFAETWRQLLRRAGFSGTEPLEQFDRIVEASPGDPGADLIEDTPIGYGNPIGERHAPRWILRVPRTGVAHTSTST
jgi:hypothetical protein